MRGARGLRGSTCLADLRQADVRSPRARASPATISLRPDVRPHWRANAQSGRAALLEGYTVDSRPGNGARRFRSHYRSRAGPNRPARQQRRHRGSEAIHRDHADRMGANGRCKHYCAVSVNTALCTSNAAGFERDQHSFRGGENGVPELERLLHEQICPRRFLALRARRITRSQNSSPCAKPAFRRKICGS